ncbi:hypothetical protein ACIBCO_35585, partial [Streptomyces violascens]|uniref:hypothetical protein n=1 Tax=Streptomyces violascens TaxID=67381 RepID=UPI00379A6E1A
MPTSNNLRSRSVKIDISLHQPIIEHATRPSPLAIGLEVLLNHPQQGRSKVLLSGRRRWSRHGDDVGEGRYEQIEA